MEEAAALDAGSPEGVVDFSVIDKFIDCMVSCNFYISWFFSFSVSVNYAFYLSKLKQSFFFMWYFYSKINKF